MLQYDCRAGYARLDITPPLGVRLGGYGSLGAVRASTGVLDPIYVRAIAFGQGDRTAVMLVLDMLGMYGPELEQWPPRIAQRLGLPREAVFACCTHSHTTPVVTSFREPSDPQYDEWLFRRLGDAARMAVDDLKPVTDVRGGETVAEGMAFVRRFMMKNGTVQTNPAYSRPEEIEGPACGNDQSLRLMRILRQDGPEIVLVNFQAHPDNIGGTLVSADYPGAVCRRVEELAPNTCCVFLDGAEGQMVRTDRMHWDEEDYTKDHPHCVAYGERLADKAMEIYHTVPSTGMTGLGYGQRTVRGATKRGLLPREEYERIIALDEAGRRGEIHPDPKQAWYQVLLARSVRDMELKQIDAYDMPVTVLTFCGLAFVGMPGEPFNELGKKLRASSPYPVTNVCCQTNACYGYIPTDEGFDQGGFEPTNTRLTRGVAGDLLQAAQSLLDTL